jgi:hypothetical protein
VSNTTLTNETGRKLALLILIGMLAQLLVIGYVFYSAYERRVEMTGKSRVACERNKLDRADNADFQRAHTKYITSVTGAASVQEDVKRAARKAVVTFRRTSNSLTSRSKIDCKTAFPDPTLFP